MLPSAFAFKNLPQVFFPMKILLKSLIFVTSYSFWKQCLLDDAVSYQEFSICFMCFPWLKTYFLFNLLLFTKATNFLLSFLAHSISKLDKIDKKRVV